MLTFEWVSNSGEIYYEDSQKYFFVDATTFLAEDQLEDFNPQQNSNFHF